LSGTIGCQKELSKDTLGSGGTGGGGGGSASGSAQFSLVPSGSNCSDAVVAGIYEAGTALGVDAMMTVTVNVTKAGDWTYTTAMVNGFLFAGAGTFSATGTQVITLQAAGKPINAGNTLFKLNISGANCIVSVPVNPAGTGGTVYEYYKVTIDGVNYYQAVTATNDYEAGRGLAGVDDVAFGAGINYANPPLPAGKTEFGIDRAFMHNYQSATDAQFKAFFAVGDYPYSALSNDLTDNGIKIFWTDTKGEVWDSRDKADQTGSTFKIISVTDFTDIAGDYNVTVKVQFTCKLYNSTGASKTVTNGEAVVTFGKI
jgi:hypothetical protein